MSISKHIEVLTVNIIAARNPGFPVAVILYEKVALALIDNCPSVAGEDSFVVRFDGGDAVGGQGSDENISEAQCMYDALVRDGISADRLYLEPNSTSTKENLDFSLKVIEENGLSRNIAVVTNTIPNTGISLPLFSYGGSALMMTLGELGVVLSVSKKSNLSKI